MRPTVLHISYSARRGGAAIAAHRLHNSFDNSRVRSSMLVTDRSGPDRSIFGPETAYQRFVQRIRKNLEIHGTRLILRPKGEFSPGWFGNDFTRRIREIDPDIIHLHWVNFGYLDLAFMKSWKRPIVWTMHDMWPFTGGCHYSGDCERFLAGCGACPAIRSRSVNDVSRRLVERKRDAWKSLSMRIVSPSRWLAEKARRSALFRDREIDVIPNGLDTDLFAPLDKVAARQKYGLSPDRLYLMFAAVNATSDPRKGFAVLKQALASLANREPRGVAPELIVVGNATEEAFRDIPFQTRAFGSISDQRQIAELYAAADLFVAPSLEDNLPNTAIEALACGVPVVGFRIGGLPEIVDDRINGRLAPTTDPSLLAECIAWCLEDRERLSSLSTAARQTALDRFCQSKQADAFARLYLDLLHRAGDR